MTSFYFQIILRNYAQVLPDLLPSYVDLAISFPGVYSENYIFIFCIRISLMGYKNMGYFYLIQASGAKKLHLYVYQKMIWITVLRNKRTQA